MGRPKGSKNKARVLTDTGKSLDSIAQLVCEHGVITDPSANNGIVLSVLITNDMLNKLGDGSAKGSPAPTMH